MKYAALWLVVGALGFAQPSRYNLGLSMSSPLASAVADLSSSDPVMRSAAATEIYRRGRAPADRVVYIWWSNPGFAELFGASPAVTVGLAVKRATFARIREANGLAPLARVPADFDSCAKSTQARRTSPTLQACAIHPFGANGASPSKISPSVPSPYL